jgi:hypothetical protein
MIWAGMSELAAWNSSDARVCEISSEALAAAYIARVVAKVPPTPDAPRAKAPVPLHVQAEKNLFQICGHVVDDIWRYIEFRDAFFG